MTEREVITLQFVLLGESGVGKTCLFERYFSHSFNTPKATIISTQNSKEIVVSHLGHNVIIKLRIWDTAGEEKFRALMPQYFRGTHGFIVVYDVTDRASFDSLDNIIDEAETFATIEDHIKIVVGNKIDKKNERVVSRAEGLKYAHSKRSLFIEASAKSNEAVDHIFEKLAVGALLKSNLLQSIPREAIRLQDPPPVKSYHCWCS